MLESMQARFGHEAAAEMAIPSYLHRNPVLRWMAIRRLDVVADWLCEDLGPEARVLDFGCGTGVLLPVACGRAREVFATDLELGPASMLVEHCGLTNARMLEPARLSEIEPGSLDAIVAAEVLEHIEELEPVFATFRRLLAPDGRLIVSLPTENALYRAGRRLAGFSGEYHVGDAANVHRALETSGFRTRRCSALPLPGPFAIYWVVEYGAPQP
jgi:2-polyprenyl-3-methyl-5-hydroxy-6-metoxy-1,4-benzoquinol methylase